MLPELPFDVERLHSDKEYRLELRHRCITDGFFLAPLLGYHDFNRRIHQPVADLYISKCPGISIPEQHPIKNRLHLDPRHTFKTTWGFVDTAQWILAFPDITIANVTATQGLAKLIVARLGRIFEQPKTKPPTPLQILFPEYVINKLKGNYIAPCRTRDEVEPTIYATSPGSSQSGWHPWIINPDDMVDTENSGIDASEDSRDRIWNTYTTNLNTLRAGGYVNIRGTRYHPFDAYGRLLRVMNPAEWKMLVRSSMRVLTLDRYGYAKRIVEGEFPPRQEVDLLFEEMLPYSKLKSIFNTDYRSFMCQQQNDPDGGGVAIFPAARYSQAQIADERIPSIGDIRICWRLPCEEKGWKYAEGAAIKYIGARAYVVESWRGIYTPTELHERIVDSARRLQCGELTIEQTPGSDSEIPHIQNEGTRRNWPVRIERPEYESSDSVRRGRMRNLEPRMQTGRLWFATGMLQADEMKKQFTNFGLIESNGLVDVVSRLANCLPAGILQAEVSAEQRAMLANAKERGIYDAIFGQGGAAEVEAAVIAEHYDGNQQRNSYGLRPVLGGLDG